MIRIQGRSQDVSRRESEPKVERRLNGLDRALQRRVNLFGVDFSYRRGNLVRSVTLCADAAITSNRTCTTHRNRFIISIPLSEFGQLT